MSFRRGNSQPPNRVFQALAASSRREILAILLDRSTPASEQDIAAHVRAINQSETQKPATAGANSTHTELIHTHLPALEDAGLIQWHRDDATVDLAPHPAFDDPRFRLLLEVEADGLDVALANLAFDRRRIVLTTLRDAPESVTQKDLARELLRSNDIDRESCSNAVDNELVLLCHFHLPALSDADLIEYDPDTARATYTDHPALEEVFTIIYESDDRLLDSCNGFIEGMNAAFNELTRGTGTEAEWPHFWRDPSNG